MENPATLRADGDAAGLTMTFMATRATPATLPGDAVAEAAARGGGKADAPGVAAANRRLAAADVSERS